ncbi:MAG: protein kinase domain-containing protein, partial [Bacteroidota bacterium]
MTVGAGGTLYYMPPEQMRGLANVDHRGDIYSIGMTLYEAVAGRLPFDEKMADLDIRQMIAGGRIPSPDTLNPGLPGELVAIICKAIEANPENRFQSCEEMGGVLDEFRLSEQRAKQAAAKAQEEQARKRQEQEWRQKEEAQRIKDEEQRRKEQELKRREEQTRKKEV